MDLTDKAAVLAQLREAMAQCEADLEAVSPGKYVVLYAHNPLHQDDAGYGVFGPRLAVFDSLARSSHVATAFRTQARQNGSDAEVKAYPIATALQIVKAKNAELVAHLLAVNPELV